MIWFDSFEVVLLPVKGKNEVGVEIVLLVERALGRKKNGDTCEGQHVYSFINIMNWHH